MTLDDIGAIYERYAARFGDTDGLAHPGIMTDLRFVGMMERALESGEPLTVEEVQAAFPDFNWEE